MNQKRRININSQYFKQKNDTGHITFWNSIVPIIKMTTANHLIGDLGVRSNPIAKATPEGGGSKVNDDPKGNRFGLS
jgi:hypothetical protein